MGKLAKGLVIFFSIIVTVIIAAVIIIPLVVDINDYKPEIESAVKTQTGRTLNIEGDLNLSVFPWLGFSTGKITLSNATGFPEESFATIGASEVKVKLLPLLSKEVEVSTIVLKNLTLNLAKNKEGISNWDDLARPSQEPASQQTQEPQAGSGSTSGSALAALAIGGVVIENSQIRWTDLQSGQQASIKDFNLTLGSIAFNEPIAIKMSFNLDNKTPALNEQLSLSTKLTLDESFQTYQLTQLNINSTTKGELLSGGEAIVHLQSDITIDLQQKKFQLTAFEIDSTTKGDIIPGGLLKAHIASEITLDLNQQIALINGLKLKTNLINLTGDIKLTQLNTDLQYAGPIQIAQFNPKALLTQLQMEPPKTSDPQALTQLAMDFNLQGSSDSLSIEKLNIFLDESKIKGFTRVKNFKTPEIAFNLAIDDIDVDRYNAPTTEKATPPPVTTPATAAVAATTLIPVETIRSLNVSGNLTIEKLKAAQLKMTGVSLNLQAKHGLLRTKQAIKQLYNGHYQGQTTINAKPKTPVITLNEKISNVQIEPLLKDLQPNEEARVKGAVNLIANLKTTGNNIATIKSTLGGNLSFSLHKGAIKGFNVQEMIDIGKLAIKGKDMRQQYANEQTVFSIIKGTARIKNGLINNPDFLAESSTVEIKGGGTANLVNEALNYKVTAKVKQSPNKAMGNIKGRPVAISVRGTFSAPSYSLDVMSMVSEREQEKIDKAISKGQKEIDKHLGKGTGKAVNDLLKSFF